MRLVQLSRFRIFLGTTPLVSFALRPASKPAMVFGASDFETALNGLSAIIDGVEKIMARRAEKRRQKELHLQGQRHFIQQFTYAGAPDDDALEEQTIRSYCKKLRDIIRNHLSFIFGRTPYDAMAAHAFMANTAFHMGAMPGLPPRQNQTDLVTGYIICLMV